jgi:predicted GTPase
MASKRQDSPFLEILFKDTPQTFLVTNKAELKQALQKAEKLYGELLDGK